MKKLKLEELGRESIEDYKQKPKIPLIVVADNIRSGLNIGALFRTGDAFMIESIAICGISATPPNKEITKSAIGATHSVSWHYYPTTLNCIEHLKKLGYTIIAIEQTDQSIQLNQFAINPLQQYALILGNEVSGIDETILHLIDYSIEIPQYGTKHSLNVSVCAGIVIHHFSSKMIENRL